LHRFADQSQTRWSFAASLLVCVTLAVSAPAFAASTLSYPGAAPCDTTLQACINAGTAGDTVELAFDNLNDEDVLVSDKSLTLQPAAGRTPKLKSLFVIANKTAVAFAVKGLAGIGQLTAFCGNADLTLVVRDNVIGGAGSGLRIYDNYALTASGLRTLDIIGNRISINGAGADNAISILGSTSPFVANVIDNDIRLVGSTTSAGIAVEAGANSVRGMSNRVIIDRNRITGADYNAGMVFYAYGGNDNTSPTVSLDANVSNNLVAGQNGNTGVSGGIAVYSGGSNTTINARIVNNTVVDGRTGISIGGRGDLNGGGNITLRNNIVAWNSYYGIGVAPEMLFASACNLTFANGSSGTQPAGTTDADPRFVDRAAQDYRIRGDSPAVNAGLDAALSPTLTLDAAGNPRRIGRIDIGAYEMSAPPSYTVTPSAGVHGTISPATVQTLAANATATFTVVPESGYTASVGGTCGGTLTDAGYTTNPLQADCTVVASFAPIPHAPTTTSLVLAAKSVQTNQPLIVSVAVSSNLPTLAPTTAAFAPVTATGSVTVSSTGGMSCTVTLVNGGGSCTLSHATPGMYAINATYQGDAQNAPSSATASLVVTAVPTPGPERAVAAPALSTWMLGLLVALLAAAGVRRRGSRTDERR
jgi:hypothetical protein